MLLNENFALESINAKNAINLSEFVEDWISCMLQ